VDGWLAFELHESATGATSHRASGGLPVVHKGRSDAGGRSPTPDDSLSSRLSRRRSWWSPGVPIAVDRVVGDCPAVSGGATADRAVLGRHGGYPVAVGLGEVVGHHQ
jgi:hypothetical protein